jgi:2-isopropylmalate synthase
MPPEFGHIIQAVTDKEGRELLHDEIYQVFCDEYLNPVAPFELKTFHVEKRHIAASADESSAVVEATLIVNGHEQTIAATGNGPLDAFCTALKADITGDFRLRNYHEHALDVGSSAKAAAYIKIEYPDGTVKWGVAVDTDIIIASVKAVLSSLDRAQQ